MDPSTFVAVGVETITMWPPFQVGASSPLATHWTQMVALDLNKGRLMVDLEVG